MNVVGPAMATVAEPEAPTGTPLMVALTTFTSDQVTSAVSVPCSTAVN